MKENGSIPPLQPSKFPPAEDYDAVRGRILFLPPFERIEASALRRNEAYSPDIHVMWYEEENKEGFGHPVVVLSRFDKYLVKCHLLTSFGGQKLEDKHQSTYTRQMYVPIEPSHDHPDSTWNDIPKLRFCWGLGAKTKPGYVVVREPITVDWRDLELWQEDDPSLFFASYVRFDAHDMERLDKRTKRLREEELLHRVRVAYGGFDPRSPNCNWRFKQLYEPHRWMEYRRSESIRRCCLGIRRQIKDLRLNKTPLEEGICHISGHTFFECAQLTEQERRRTYYIQQLKTMRHYNNVLADAEMKKIDELGKLVQAAAEENSVIGEQGPPGDFPQENPGERPGSAYPDPVGEQSWNGSRRRRRPWLPRSSTAPPSCASERMRPHQFDRRCDRAAEIRNGGNWRRL